MAEFMSRDVIEIDLDFIRDITAAIAGLPYAFIGGAARRWVLDDDRHLRDVDICVDVEPRVLDHIVHKQIEDVEVTRNSFGGYKLKPAMGGIGGYEVDIWSLSETWSIKKAIEMGFSHSFTFDSLVALAFFNVDALAITNEGKVIDWGFESAIRDGVLKVGFPHNPFPADRICQGLKHLKTYNLRPGQCFLDYIGDFASRSGPPKPEPPKPEPHSCPAGWCDRCEMWW